MTKTKKIPFILLTIIIISFIILIYGIKNHIEERINNYLSGYQLVKGIVAYIDISANTILSEDMLATRKIPKKFLPSDYVKIGSDYTKLIGKRLIHSVVAKDIIRWCDVEDSKEHLSHNIPINNRCIIIENIKGISSVIFKPEDYVDILLTWKNHHNRQESNVTFLQNRQESTVTLLQNILILAVGNQLSSFNKKNMSNNNSLSVLVSPYQAKLLTFAKNQGTLSAILRNPKDNIIIQDNDYVTYKDIDSNDKTIEVIKAKKVN